MSIYQTDIRDTLGRMGWEHLDPRWVEAWMRSEHPTLDGLSRERFNVEVSIAAVCAANDVAMSEKLARSYGL